MNFVKNINIKSDQRFGSKVMCYKNFINTIFGLLYLYGITWMLIDIVPKIRTNLIDYILKKETPYGVQISMCVINVLSTSFFFINKIISSHKTFDTYELVELKRIRQLYLLISVYVIVIHIEYIVWILTCVVFYIYINICLYISEIISEKELDLHNSNTQSVQVAEIESGNHTTTHIIGTPLFHQSVDHH